MKYRVTVEATVCVEAANMLVAKMRAETALRQAVKLDYEQDGLRRLPLWADGWEAFTFRARKAERVQDA